jgi:hypothetical protein
MATPITFRSVRAPNSGAALNAIDKAGQNLGNAISDFGGNIKQGAEDVQEAETQEFIAHLNSLGSDQERNEALQNASKAFLDLSKVNPAITEAENQDFRVAGEQRAVNADDRAQTQLDSNLEVNNERILSSIQERNQRDKTNPIAVKQATAELLGVQETNKQNKITNVTAAAQGKFDLKESKAKAKDAREAFKSTQGVLQQQLSNAKDAGEQAQIDNKLKNLKNDRAEELRTSRTEIRRLNQKAELNAAEQINLNFLQSESAIETRNNVDAANPGPDRIDVLDADRLAFTGDKKIFDRTHQQLRDENFLLTSISPSEFQTLPIDFNRAPEDPVKVGEFSNFERDLREELQGKNTLVSKKAIQIQVNKLLSNDLDYAAARKQAIALQDLADNQNEAFAKGALERYVSNDKQKRQLRDNPTAFISDKLIPAINAKITDPDDKLDNDDKFEFTNQVKNLLGRVHTAFPYLNLSSRDKDILNLGVLNHLLDVSADTRVFNGKIFSSIFGSGTDFRTGDNVAIDDVTGPVLLQNLLDVFPKGTPVGDSIREKPAKINSAPVSAEERLSIRKKAKQAQLDNISDTVSNAVNGVFTNTGKPVKIDPTNSRQVAKQKALQELSSDLGIPGNSSNTVQSLEDIAEILKRQGKDISVKDIKKTLLENSKK